MPGYVFLLDDLAAYESLRGVVIYRDGRDVVSSTLQKARTQWKDLPWVTNLDTARKVATNWVTAVDAMDRNAARIHSIRYEGLVRDTAATLDVLADWLDVDPGGFPPTPGVADSIGKHRGGLTEAELDDVMEIAGPALARLGCV